MPAGYRNGSGVDFDSLFDPYVSGTKAANSGLRDSSGVDLSNRYAPISVGSKGANVNYRTSAGVDVSNLWAAIGTASYSLPIDGNTYSAASSGTVSSAMTASVTTAIKSDGTYAVTCVSNSTHSANASGTWLPAGDAVSDYQVQFVVTTNSTYTSGGATITNDAAAYAACTTTRNVQASCAAGQLSAQDKGGTYTVVINLKKISTGAVQVTTIHYNVESVGSG